MANIKDIYFGLGFGLVGILFSKTSFFCVTEAVLELGSSFLSFLGIE